MSVIYRSSNKSEKKRKKEDKNLRVTLATKSPKELPIPKIVKPRIELDKPKI